MIRKAKEEDLKIVAELLKEVFYDEPFNERWSDEDSLSVIKDYFKSSNIFIKIVEEEIVGFMIVNTFLWWSGHVGKIDELGVKKEFRDKGLGKELITFAENFFKEKKCTKSTLLTNEKSKAFGIYTSMGYTKEGLISLIKDI